MFITGVMSEGRNNFPRQWPVSGKKPEARGYRGFTPISMKNSHFWWCQPGACPKTAVISVKVEFNQSLDIFITGLVNSDVDCPGKTHTTIWKKRIKIYWLKINQTEDPRKQGIRQNCSGFRKEKRTYPPALQSTGESDIPIGMMNAVIRIKNREKTKK